MAELMPDGSWTGNRLYRRGQRCGHKLSTMPSHKTCELPKHLIHNLPQSASNLPIRTFCGTNFSLHRSPCEEDSGQEAEAESAHPTVDPLPDRQHGMSNLASQNGGSSVVAEE